MQTATRHIRAPLPYLAEARALYDLLRDGHDRLRFHISRGHAVRHAATGQVELSSYVEAGRWLPARALQPDGTLTDRPFNPQVLARHLAGRYDVAWEAPSWSSLIVFDIDCHVSPDLPPAQRLVARREAALARDQVLARLWRAFDFGPDKQPVILKTPSGGYHVYMPLLGPGASGAEGLWPNASLRRWLEAHLAARGLGLMPGRLELFPTGVRLRAPCGRGMLLLAPARPDAPDDLALHVVPGTYRGEPGRGLEVFLDEQPDGGLVARRLQPQFEARRNVPALVQAFLGAIAQARRPLHAWLGQPEPLWDTTWGPFGRDRTEPSAAASAGRSVRAQHKEDVQGGCGPCPHGSPGSRGWLRYGRDFLRYIVDLSEHGLTEPGRRHDAALKLTFYFGAVLALPRDEVLARLEEWLRAFAHRSSTFRRSEPQFLRHTLREAAHYYDHHVVSCALRGAPRRVDIAHRPLAQADLVAVRAAVATQAWDAVKALLGHLKGFADAAGVVGAPVELSHRTLLLVCGDRRLRSEDGRRRRAYLVALEELARVGVLTLHTNYSTGRHARRFSVWYRFGSGVLPGVDAQTGHRLLARREVTEGTVAVLAPGDGTQLVRLEPGQVDAGEVALEAASACSEVTVPGQPGAGRAWWRRMFARRLFTVAELLQADERTVVPGPWTWRRPIPSQGRPRAPGLAHAHGLAPPSAAPPPPAPPPGEVLSCDERPALVVSAPRDDDGLGHAIDEAWAAFERARRGDP